MTAAACSWSANAAGAPASSAAIDSVERAFLMGRSIAPGSWDSRSMLACAARETRSDRERRMTVTARSFLYELDAESGVATITLNRPERLNALTFEVYADLRGTFTKLDTEPGVRAIVITGAGRGFCSGGDVEDIIGALFGRDSAGLLEFTKMTCDLVANIRPRRPPGVAALNCTVAGAGAGVAAAGHLRIPAPSAQNPFPLWPVRPSGAAMR